MVRRLYKKKKAARIRRMAIPEWFERNAFLTIHLCCCGCLYWLEAKVHAVDFINGTASSALYFLTDSSSA